jgi:hypothetical protein
MQKLLHMLLLVLAAVCLPPGAARAQPLPSVLDAAGAIPMDADLVLVIENASDLRSTAVAAAAAGLFGADGLLGDSRIAWRALAAELGWTEDEAFDRLLGRRVVLVARGIEKPDTSRWVLLSQVSMETDRRLKERLKAAPRGIAQGQQMLAIEQGRYELTSFRLAEKRSKDREDDRAVTMLLAPAGRSELLDAMLEQRVKKQVPLRPLRGEPVFAEASKLGEPEILLLARLGDRGVAGAAWPDFAILSASRRIIAGEPMQWTVRVALRERARQQELIAAGLSSDAAFNALSPASLLAVVQMAPLATIFGHSLPFDDPLTNLPWPQRAMELFTGRQIIRVHAVTGEEPGAVPGLACTLAMQATDGRALAEVLDPSIATFFAEVERAAGQRDDTTPPFPNFAGTAPHAMRSLGVELGNAGPLVGVTGSGLSAAWTFPMCRDGSRTWWTLAMAGAGEGSWRAPAAVRDMVAAVGGAGKEAAGTHHRWIWLMSARPRELEALFAPGVPDFRGVRSFMRRVSEAGCRLSITEQGDIQGELILRLSEPEGR